MASRRSYRLVFVHGLYNGETKTIDQERLVIGSSTEADLTVLDNGVAAQHLSILSQATVFGPKLTLTAMADGVQVDNGPVLAAKQTTSLRMGSTVSFGGTTVRIETIIDRKIDRPKRVGVAGRVQGTLDGASLDSMRQGFQRALHNSRPVRADAKRYLRSGATEAKSFLWLLIAAVIIGGGLGLFTSPKWFGEMTEKINEKLGPTVAENAPTAELIAGLVDRLSEANLDNQISVEAGPGNTVIVTGKLPQTKAKEWKTIQMWFDRASGGAMLVGSLNAIHENKIYLSVASVWGGNPPYIVSSDGRHVTVGENIGSGWTIKDINDSGLIVERTGKEISVPYAQLR